MDGVRRGVGPYRVAFTRYEPLRRAGLYPPKSWASDAERCRVAGIASEVQFATKPALATAMITRAIQAGVPAVPAGWVAGDEVYGADPLLRRAIREHHLGYAHARPGLAALLVRAWQQKAPQHDWAWIGLLPENDDDPDDIGEHHLLIRRTPATGELAYLRCYSPHRVPLSTLVRVAGQRWRIEESFQSAKGLVGLDQHQVRRWTSWLRWTTLAMLDHAFLAVATAIERDHAPAPAGVVELTVNEFRRLFDAPLLAAHARSTHCWPGPIGADDIKPAHATVTTGDGSRHINDHELRLSY